MPKQFTLGKSERLKSRKAIDELFKNGKRFTVSPFRVFYCITKEGGLQFGAGVSTKNFKKAVDRNRIKRLIREAYRVQKNSLEILLKAKGLNLFFIYTEKELPDYHLIYSQVEKVIRKLSSIINEDIS
ncbi:MAG: ribonuclease P protein component [Chitinophagaceae bacterium]|nr:ribonuclease P protein component [Chitinophagaceae bacterium]